MLGNIIDSDGGVWSPPPQPNSLPASCQIQAGPAGRAFVGDEGRLDRDLLPASARDIAGRNCGSFSPLHRTLTPGALDIFPFLIGG